MSDPDQPEPVPFPEGASFDMSPHPELPIHFGLPAGVLVNGRTFVVGVTQVDPRPTEPFSGGGPPAYARWMRRWVERAIEAIEEGRMGLRQVERQQAIYALRHVLERAEWCARDHGE